LKARFASMLAQEEDISEREARRDVGAITREQLEAIYGEVEARISSDDSGDGVGFLEVVNEVNVHDILPTLAANAARARRW
jgi:hypothetical protein